jgi:hypothetical protein
LPKIALAMLTFPTAALEPTGACIP